MNEYASARHKRQETQAYDKTRWLYDGYEALGEYGLISI